MIQRLEGVNYSPGRPIKSQEFSPLETLVITDGMGRRGAIASATIVGLPTTGVVTSPPVMDGVPPVALNTATTIPTPLPSASTTPVLLEVTYTDETMLETATIVAGNVTATLNGVGMSVALQSANVISAAQVEATYSLLPADGTWDEADTGTINWSYGANLVLDMAGNPAPAIAGVIPVAVEIEIARFTTTATGTQTIGVDITSSGAYTVDWGDGTTITGTGSDTRQYTDALTSHDVVVRTSDPAGVTVLTSSSSRIINAVVSSSLTELRTLNVSGNQLTSFVTHPEWVSLTTLNLGNNDLTSIDLRPEWVDVRTITLSNNQLTSLVTHPEWVSLRSFGFSNNQLTSFATHPEWVDLRTFSGSNNLLTALITHPEWVDLRNFTLNNNQIASLATYSTWVSLLTFNASSNQLTSFVTHPEWVALRSLNIGNNQIPSIATHPEWVALRIFAVNSNLFTTLATHPEWVDLRTFNIGSNTISSVDIRPEWVLLDELDIAMLQIADLNPLYVILANPVFAETGKTVDSSSNPGSAGLLSANITNATANGWAVTN